MVEKNPYHSYLCSSVYSLTRKESERLISEASILLSIFFSCSDNWRSCKLCGICVCPCSACDSSRCIEYHREVTYFQYHINFYTLKSFFSKFTLLMLNMVCCSAVLAYFILNEKLHRLGILGCVMCIVGSVIIVINAPQERPISSVREIWSMATQPGRKKISLSSYF